MQWVPDLIADIDFPKLLELAERQPLIGVNRDLVPPEWLAPSVKVAQFVEAQSARLNDSQVDVEVDIQRQRNASAKDLPVGTYTSENVKDQSDATGSLVGDSSQDPGLSKGAVSDGIPASFSDMATQNNLTEVAGNWARLRFGNDWECDAVLKNQATVVLGKFLRGGREVTAAFLDLMVMVLGNQLDQETAEAFLKYRFGDKYFKDAGKLKKAKAVLIDLLESGKDVAQAYMRTEIAKAA